MTRYLYAPMTSTHKGGTNTS